MKKILGIVALIIVVIAVAGFGLHSCGLGFESGNGGGDGTADSSKVKDEKEEKEERDVITIKVDESTIYLDDEKCDDIDDLKDKISKIQAADKEKKYVYNNEYAIKETDDEVSEILRGLEENLEITVDFNE